MKWNEMFILLSYKCYFYEWEQVWKKEKSEWYNIIVALYENMFYNDCTMAS